MSVITIESLDGTRTVCTAQPGERLLDACDACDAPVPFSCRATTCGTCAVDVLEGEDLLTPPDSAELALLATHAAPHGRRFACSAVVRVGSGSIRLRPCGRIPR